MALIFTGFPSKIDIFRKILFYSEWNLYNYSDSNHNYSINHCRIFLYNEMVNLTFIMILVKEKSLLIESSWKCRMLPISPYELSPLLPKRAIRDTRLGNYLSFDSWVTRQIFPQYVIVSFLGRLVCSQGYKTQSFLLFNPCLGEEEMDLYLTQLYLRLNEYKATRWHLKYIPQTSVRNQNRLCPMSKVVKKFRVEFHHCVLLLWYR